MNTWNGKTAERDCLMKGSLTVEASLIMSVFLIVWLMLLQVTFWQTDLVRMEALMAESSIRMAENIPEGRHYLRSSGGFFRMDVTDVRDSAGKDEITLKCFGAPVPWMEAVDLKTQLPVRHPVSWMRKISHLVKRR